MILVYLLENYRPLTRPPTAALLILPITPRAPLFSRSASHSRQGERGRVSLHDCQVASRVGRERHSKSDWKDEQGHWMCERTVQPRGRPSFSPAARGYSYTNTHISRTFGEWMFISLHWKQELHTSEKSSRDPA